MTSPRLLALIAALLAAGFGGAAEASHCSGPLPEDALREAELVVEGVARARREVNGKLFYLVEVTRVFKGTLRRWIIVRQCMQCIWMKPDTPSYSFLREDLGLWTAVDCYDGHPVAEHQADLAKPLNEQRRNVYGAELNVERLLQALEPAPGASAASLAPRVEAPRSQPGNARGFVLARPPATSQWQLVLPQLQRADGVSRRSSKVI